MRSLLIVGSTKHWIRSNMSLPVIVSSYFRFTVWRCVIRICHHRYLITNRKMYPMELILSPKYRNLLLSAIKRISTLEWEKKKSIKEKIAQLTERKSRRCSAFRWLNVIGKPDDRCCWTEKYISTYVVRIVRDVRVLGIFRCEYCAESEEYLHEIAREIGFPYGAPLSNLPSSRRMQNRNSIFLDIST